MRRALLILGLLAAGVPCVGSAQPSDPPIGQVIEDLKRLAAARGAERDGAWADAVAFNAGRLLEAGYVYRAAEWALTLAASRGVPDRRAEDLIEEIPPRALSEDELLYLGCLASRGGDAAAPALLALARVAHEGRSAVTPRLVAGARALGADSAAAIAVGVGLPAPRRLAFFTIGILAPVNGRLARQGEAMVRGAQLAIEEANRDSPFPLTLEVGDTRGEPLAAARAVGELITAGVGALAGDLLIATTIPAAAAAEAASIPLVSPAPGRNDLGTIGSHVFQSIAPRVLQAEAVARAAVSQLGYRRLAILEPDTPAGTAIADRFAAEAKRLGAEVVERQRYRAGETNFADLGRLAPRSPDAVFVPGTPRELMAAVPQLNYYEVGGRVLALEDLALKEVLEATREFLPGAVFAESYYGVPALDGETFAQRYARRFKGEPDAHAARGYVAARVLADAIVGGARSPAAIRAVLAARTAPGSGLIEVSGTSGEVALFRVAEKGGGIEPLRLSRSN